jgi:amino-acid N-acetyltransferase
VTANDVRATPSLHAALALLEAAGLPSSDLTETHLAHFLYCGSRDAPSGLVGLELYEPDALLRSLAVAPSVQHAGLGSALVHHAEHYARERRVRSLYLLTTTARVFFEKHGYRVISREDCPPAIRTTSEFATICPTSSTVMRKILA